MFNNIRIVSRTTRVRLKRPQKAQMTDPIGSLVSIHLALLVSIVSNQTLKLGTCNRLVSHFVQLTVWTLSQFRFMF